MVGSKPPLVGWWGPGNARVVLVGEAPSRLQDERGSFDAALMRRELAELAGVSFPDGWRALFGRVNLLERWPGAASGKGDSFPPEPARAAAVALEERLAVQRVPLVVLMGRRVEHAFRWLGHPAPWFEIRSSPCRDLRPKLVLRRVGVSPHPSGVNHWWNDPKNREQARAFWRAVGEFARTSRDDVLAPFDPAERAP